MVEVKICGLTDPAALDVALASGARFVGLVFFPPSPRSLSLEAAAGLAQRARGRADIVAVVVDADDAQLAAVASAVDPDYLQLHGSETPGRAASVRRFARKGVIKALPIAESADLEQVKAFAGAVQRVLLDAKPPTASPLPGGNGTAFDWALLQGRTLDVPWFLSGGLTPKTVSEAIRLSRARAVDVSSGVEMTPAVKDLGLIQAFLTAAGAPSPEQGRPRLA